MIVVFGSINLDLIFPVVALPAPGQTILAAAARIEPGGKGANQAVAAARDGAGVILAGAVGRDPLAGQATAGLRAAGVDLTRVIVTDQPTGCAAITLDEAGRNHIVVASGANLAARAAQVEDALLGPGTILVLQRENDPAETAALITRARLRATQIVLNLAPAAALPPAAMRAVDILVANEDEAAWLAASLGSGGDAAGLASALGVRVVRTLGSAGVEAATDAGLLRIPGHQVDAVDTAAAGDCFVGVLAAGLAHGRDWAAALTRANRAASLACMRRGTQSSLPSAADTDASRTAT